MDKLLTKENIHKLTVKQICEEAEVNRSTFYKYYGSQYDLLEEMERDLIAQINSCMSTTDSGSQKEQLLTTTFSLINENIDLCRLLLNNNIDSEFPEKLVVSLQVMQTVIYQQLLSRYSKDEFDYIFSFIIGGGFSLIKAWINKENREPSEKIAALLDSTLEKLLQE